MYIEGYTKKQIQKNCATHKMRNTKIQKIKELE